MCVGYHVVWVLEELVQHIPHTTDIYVMYNIACSLVQHLKGRNKEHLLNRVRFSLPSFHAYGHNMYSSEKMTGIMSVLIIV